MSIRQVPRVYWLGLSLAWLQLTFLGLPCSAEGEVILVVEQGDALSAALRTSLSSWQVRVERVTTEGSAAEFDQAAAHRLAQKTGAAAITWLQGKSGDAELHTFVSAPQQTTSRESLDPWPLAPDAAAALALSVKALLRNTPLAPVAERQLSAEHKPVAEGEPAAEEKLAAQDNAPLLAPRGKTTALPRFRAELQAGARSAPASHTGPPFSFAGALAVYEPWLSASRLGVYLQAGAGTATKIDRGDISATLSQQYLTVGARGLLALTQRLRLELALGTGVQRVHLSGEERATGEAVSAHRLNGLLSGSLGIELGLVRFVVLTPRLSCDRMLRTQRYFGRSSQPLSESSRWVLQGALALGLAFP